jgi:hypothetical protein
MLNPVLVYIALGVYGVILLLVVAYVHAKFSAAARTLQMLSQDWNSAASKHAGFIDKAQEQITRLAAPAPAVPAPVSSEPLHGDVRNQVVTLGNKGMATTEIARSCGLPEGEVDVMLGLAKIQAPR